MLAGLWVVGYIVGSGHVFDDGFYDRFQELAITTNPSLLVRSFVGVGCTMGSSGEFECRWWSRRRVVDVHDVGVVHDVGSCGWMWFLEGGDVHDVGPSGWRCESNTA